MTETIKLIETNGKTIAIVEVPEGANKFEMGGTCPSCIKSGMWHCSEADTCGCNFPALKIYLDDIFSKSIQLPPGEWQMLGKSTELSEEQKEQVVELLEWEGLTVYILYPNDPEKRNFTASREESYLSLLQANGIVDRNPYEKPNEETIMKDATDIAYSRGIYDWMLSSWQEAQKQVRSYLILSKK